MQTFVAVAMNKIHKTERGRSEGYIEAERKTEVVSLRPPVWHGWVLPQRARCAPQGGGTHRGGVFWGREAPDVCIEPEIYIHFYRFIFFAKFLKILPTLSAIVVSS